MPGADLRRRSHGGAGRGRRAPDRHRGGSGGDEQADRRRPPSSPRLVREAGVEGYRRTRGAAAGDSRGCPFCVPPGIALECPLDGVAMKRPGLGPLTWEDEQWPHHSSTKLRRTLALCALVGAPWTRSPPRGGAAAGAAAVAAEGRGGAFLGGRTAQGGAGRPAGAGAAVSGAGGRRQAARRQDQGARRLQGRGVRARDPRRARHAPGRQGHALRQLELRRRQDLRRRRHGRQARGEDDRREADAAERDRVPQGLALRGDAQGDHALRRHREHPRQAEGSRARLRQAAGSGAARLEIHQDRARWQALPAGGRALQHLRAQPRRVRAHPPHQPRRQRHGDRGPRRPQHRRLRLPSQDRRALVHRQSAGLAGPRTCPTTS